MSVKVPTQWKAGLSVEHSNIVTFSLMDVAKMFANAMFVKFFYNCKPQIFFLANISSYIVQLEIL